MTLLIVDDEPDIIDGILSGVDLKGLGFDAVYTAKTGEQARELMRAHPADVLLTDIEMSDLSGLKLLEWVREQDFDTVTIFCTAYPEFNYAKKAVELQAFDYYLKPIRYEELADKLRAALRRVREIQAERQQQLYGGYWLESQPDNRVDFWNRAFRYYAAGETDGKWLTAEADKRRLPYRPDDFFTLLVFDLYRGNKLMDWGRELLDTAFENVLRELFSLPGCQVEGICAVSPGAYQMVLYQQGRGLVGRDGLISACRQFIAFCNRHMDISADCYYCADTLFSAMGVMIRKAADIFRDDVTGCNQVYDIFSYQKRDSSYVAPYLSTRLEAFLREGQWEEGKRYIRMTLESGKMNGNVNRTGLRMIRQDLMQVVMAVLQADGISAHSLFSGPEFERMTEDAISTVDQMAAFSDYLIDRTAQAAGGTSERPEGDAAVEKVRQYIDAHLSEPLSRGVLAGTVFMNPDYFAKLFKDKTGQSLTAYIKRRRIEWAKELLAGTALPVSAVAQQVGYDNLSYFSSVFHDQTGLSPGEYRKKRK